MPLFLNHSDKFAFFIFVSHNFKSEEIRSAGSTTKDITVPEILEPTEPFSKVISGCCCPFLYQIHNDSDLSSLVCFKIIAPCLFGYFLYVDLE